MEVFEILRDEDEGFLELLEQERRPYTVRRRMNPFDEYDDKDFFMRFRLQKHTVLLLLEKIEHQIETITDRNQSVSPINQLLVTLRYYASGSFYIVVGDLINISKSTTCRIVHKVTRALASLSPDYIKMPSTVAAITDIKQRFYRKARLPKVIGSIDCTHIKIKGPGGPHQEIFRNRKGYFSINVQTISSPELKIMDIVARWPGSTHDQRIFDNSHIKNRFLRNEFNNCILVADSGYANTLHVITPFIRPENELQQLYNEAVTRTRNPVERQYAIWKRRFPILAIGLRQKMETALATIVACAVLHNIAIEQNEDVPPDDPEIVNYDINFMEEINVEPPDPENFVNAREILLHEYFPQLL